MEMSASNIVAPVYSGMQVFPVVFMVVLLSAITACVSVYLYNQMTRMDRRENLAEADILMSGQSAFLFSDEKVVFATSDGRDLLQCLGDEQNAWSGVKDYLLACDQTIGEKLNALQMNGIAFDQRIADPNGSFLDVSGQPRKGLISLSLRSIDPAEAGQLSLGSFGSFVDQDLAELLDNLPFPIWSRTKDGQVKWANLSTRTLTSGDETSQTSDLVLPASFTLPDEDIGLTEERRVSVNSGDGDDESKAWYKFYESSMKNGDFFGYAIDANEVVNVERTLRRFIATLTESFAQLSTGLAIFSAERRLTIFNPAVSDLLQIDPAWLASSPGFRDFMNRARENQMIPEQKTNADWKKMIQNIERGAEDGTLSDKWVLPSGQTFKITGRPHPHGAIALMIEDISTRISLERRYRSEIEQSQTTLDYLSDAICVLDTTGALVYANAAFREVWGFDPKASPKASNIVGLTALWDEACKPTPVWGDLREFVTSLDQRAAWTSDIELLDGTSFSALFAPLPDGSTLTTFTPNFPVSSVIEGTSEPVDRSSQEHVANLSILELAIDQMKEVVGSLTESLPANAIDPIRDSISYTERLLRLHEDGSSKSKVQFEALSQDLTALLNEKDAGLALTLETVIDDAAPAPDKRLLFNIMLVVRSLVAPQENVDLSIAEMSEGISLSCMFRGHSNNTDAAKTAGLPYRILMRYVHERGGEVELDRLDDRGLLKISCTIPNAEQNQRPLGAEKDIA